jgi:hypothetical protein
MSRSFLTVLLLGGGLAAMSVAADAAPLDTTGASQCKTVGYSTDRDPKGTNVRSAPRADAPVIGHLAPRTHLGPDVHEGVEFEIVGSKDGWLLIQKQKGAPAGEFTLDPAHAEDGRGWVSGRLVGVQPNTLLLRSAPHRDAPSVAELRGPNWGPDSFIVSVVHACRDKYVEVTGSVMPAGGKPLRGWTWAPCSNQLSTCGGGAVSE